MKGLRIAKISLAASNKIRSSKSVAVCRKRATVCHRKLMAIMCGPRELTATLGRKLVTVLAASMRPCWPTLEPPAAQRQPYGLLPACTRSQTPVLASRQASR